MTIKDKREGFTLIELIIVLTLFVLLAAMTIPYSVDFYRTRIFESEVETLSGVLDRARSYAVSGRDDSSWGVAFFPEEDYYVFFRGEDYDPEDPTNQEYSVSSDIDISGASQIVFEKGTGLPIITE